MMQSLLSGKIAIFQPDSTTEAQRAPQLSNSAMLAAIGGYLDGFTYVGHGQVFANAMTGNVVLLGVNAVANSWHQSFRHLPPILAFLIGVAAGRAICSPRAFKAIRHPLLSILVIEIAALLLLGFLPGNISDFWITTSIAFIASVQVESFRKVNGTSFNSTFTTGNLRTLSESLFDWFFVEHTDETRMRIRDFTVICTVFLIGAAAGGFVVSRIGNKALWVDVFLLSIVLIRLWPIRIRLAKTQLPPG
jgi:uncharacterized membrane protein YoaK (UPF0700 family)